MLRDCQNKFEVNQLKMTSCVDFFWVRMLEIIIDPLPNAIISLLVAELDHT